MKKILSSIAIGILLLLATSQGHAQFACSAVLEAATLRQLGSEFKEFTAHKQAIRFTGNQEIAFKAESLPEIKGILTADFGVSEREAKNAVNEKTVVAVVDAILNTFAAEPNGKRTAQAELLAGC